MIAISAHRGGGEVAPRGTRDAYLTALDSLPEYVEFDVRATSDDVLVVVHDERWTPSGPRVHEMTYAELCTAAGHEVLRVRDLMSRLAEGGVIAHLDLKRPTDPVGAADLAVEVAGAEGVVITTGSVSAIRAIKHAHPRVRAVFSVGRSLRAPVWHIPLLLWRMFFPLRRIRLAGADGIAVHHQLARAGVLWQAHRAGLFVMVWTVNDEPLMRRMITDPRIDVLVTDRPRLARKLRDGG